MKQVYTEKLEDFFLSDVILFGMTGVGKTTLVEHVQRFIPLRYVSLGSITRSLNPVTPVGQQVSYLMERGGIWPLDVVSDLVVPYLEVPTPMVLDGMPKHPHEAEWLRDRLAMRPTRPAHGLVVHASETTVRSRLLDTGRQNRPETPEQTEDRIMIYKKHLAHMTQILEPVMPEVVHVDNDVLSPLETIHELTRRL